ncbi:2Fe-2S iron-sulfur cluster-binding protein [Microbacterium sp. SLBN-146]|uniref:2Fe-2S iron-sulfur cluster-binding protein n=1 Tax=Microbacterium sp. SLBN-146 TaxID=2768457 RepID=UPI001150987F|nr:2Fe-2S iron-sulfur cluster-binding protein [Microbacterium sp. SLBN-146]TQJ29877.1 2Fe-2S iron-sulfur cluster protein [Microbacterium sp. SLBN-146]
MTALRDEVEGAGVVRIEVGGEAVGGFEGQSIAGVLLAAGRMEGFFCGIGVCFACVATVNGLADVRLCQRDAKDGDVVTWQATRPGGADA